MPWDLTSCLNRMKSMSQRLISRYPLVDACTFDNEICSQLTLS